MNLAAGPSVLGRGKGSSGVVDEVCRAVTWGIMSAGRFQREKLEETTAEKQAESREDSREEAGQTQTDTSRQEATEILRIDLWTVIVLSLLLCFCPCARVMA